MTENPTQTAPPQGSSFLDDLFTRLRASGFHRETDARWFGGVCSGLASRFGVDPVPHWRELGTAPLEAMETLLGMTSTVEETNEGKLYRSPRLTAESHPDEMSDTEREALTALLGEDGLRAAFTEDYGYVAPRLGILADGTWWFLVLEPTP